jgi:hypothetical protein
MEYSELFFRVNVVKEQANECEKGKIITAVIRETEDQN